MTFAIDTSAEVLGEAIGELASQASDEHLAVLLSHVSKRDVLETSPAAVHSLLQALRGDRRWKAVSKVCASLTISIVESLEREKKEMEKKRSLLGCLTCLIQKVGEDAFGSKELTLVMQCLCVEKDFEASQEVLLAMLRHRPRALYSCFAVFAACHRTLLAVAMGDVGSSNVKFLRGMSRLYEEMVPHASALRNHCVPILFDALTFIRKNGWPGLTKAELKPGIYFLLDVCGKHQLQHLFVTLPQACRSIMRALRKDAERDHKFYGYV